MGTKLNSATQLSIASALLPDSSDGAALGSTSAEWSDLYLADGSQIFFGVDQEVTLTHVHNVGLTLSNNHANGTKLKIDNSSTGDSYIMWAVGAGDLYSMGVDDSENDRFALALGDTLASNPIMTLSTGGLLEINTNDLLRLKSGGSGYDLHVDSSNELHLSSSASNITLNKSTVEHGRINMATNDGLHISSSISNADMIFSVNDGGTQDEVLRLDGATASPFFNLDADAKKLSFNGSTATTFIGRESAGSGGEVLKLVALKKLQLSTVGADQQIDMKLADSDGDSSFRVVTAADSAVFSVTTAGAATISGDLTVSGGDIGFPSSGNATIGSALGANQLQIGQSTSTVFVPGDLKVSGTMFIVDQTNVQITSSLVFEGATANDFETTLGVIDPTADRAINLANVAGTLIPFSAASTTAIAATPAEINLLDIDVAGASEINLGLDDKFIVHDIDSSGAPETRKVKIGSITKMNRTGSYQQSGLVSIAASASDASGARVIDDLIIGKRAATQYARDTRVIFESNRNHTANRYGMGYNKTDETFVIFSTGSNPAVGLPDDGKVSGGGDSNNNQLLKLSGSGVVDVPQHDGSAAGLALAGTVVTATAAELNIIDGGTAAVSTTVVDADRVVFNDAGTMKQVAVTDLATYFQAATVVPRQQLFFSASISTGTAVNTGGQGRMTSNLQTASLEVNAHGYPKAGSLEVYLNGMLLTPSGSVGDDPGFVSYPAASGSIGGATDGAFTGVNIFDYFVSSSGGTFSTATHGRVENPTGSLPSDGTVLVVLAEAIDSDDVLTVKYLSA